MSLPPSFAPLAAYRRFVTYELIPDPDRPGKTIKRPTDVRTGLFCKVNDPAHQYGYDEAAATGRPVGFVFNEADGFFFFDVDGALEPAPGGGYQWSALAVELGQQLLGCAVEVSQSDTGLHYIGRGTVPKHACKNIGLNLELYTHDRFVALTGKQAGGDASFDATPAITAIAERYFPPSGGGEIAGWSTEPVPEWDGPKTDVELLKAAMASGKKSAAAAFGGQHVSFEDLWTANVEALAARWPSSTGPFGASEADAALVSHLAYWTGKNCDRIRDLMWQSALVRQKWEDRPVDYLDVTIMKAVSVVTNVATGRPPPAPEIVAASGMVLREAGKEFRNASDQLEMFAGCVYIIDENKVWLPTSGAILDKARFDVVFSGHVFAVDAEGRKPSDSAFDALTKNRIYKPTMADRQCFRPEHAPGSILAEENRLMVNTYIPVQTKRIVGDPSKFLNHLAINFPVPRDRDIVMHYMASMVQNPGHKFQWCPVIQGAEGNGKSLYARAVTFAVGSRYTHLVNPEAMAKTGNQFNGWIQGHLFVSIEEIYVNNRRDFLEGFKSTVTNDRIGIEDKGVKQTTGDNRANIMMFTNHRDGVPVNVDQRRYAILYTAQQTYADCLRDGLGGDYFPDLYDWLTGRRAYAHLGPDYGYAVVNEYLQTYQLTAALDPAQSCVRAPATSSTETALRLSLGRAEQEVQEAIEEGRLGFAGGWVSSIMLDRLLDTIRAAVPRNKRRELLQALGYDYHRALPEGRVHSTIAPDNGKPRLYVKSGHLAENLTEIAAVMKAYTAAQNVAGNSEVTARFA